MNLDDDIVLPDRNAGLLALETTQEVVPEINNVDTSPWL